MEYIRVAKVENVTILHHGVPTIGTLHVTPHHLIFRSTPLSRSDSTTSLDRQQHRKPPSRPPEIWITYPIIATLHRYPPCASAPPHLRLRNRDFSFLTFQFESDRECRDVFESIKALTVVKGGVEKLYAFSYTPGGPERKCNGWNVYDSLKEYERMGVGTDRCKGWRISKINKDYAFSPTYPAYLAVPANISDTTLTHAKNYRSRARIPVLTYLHPINNCTITRCAQPLPGFRGHRSIQDEKLVGAIFASSQPQSSSSAYCGSTPSPSGSSTNLQALNIEENSATSSPDASETAPQKIYGAQQHNLIIDARPLVNAYAMQAVGFGTENMDYYRDLSYPPCTKQYLHIDNIHVMRDSLQRVVEAIKDSDLTPLPPNRELLAKSNWLRHIGMILDGTSVIVKQVAVEHSHVLIHCSDGWDRTSQLSSLAQICLDPYFRTIEGFTALVEKDWVSFGHRFRDRCGFLGSEKWFIEKNGNAPAGDEAIVGEGDAPIAAGPFSGFGAGGGSGGGLGEALEKGFGQARLFFNNVSAAANKNSNSAELIESGELPNFSTIDKKSKSATPVTASPGAGVPTKVKEVSPVFHQFLDATYQLLQQHPTRFEYNERFLRRLLYHLYSCQYGTFLYNNEKERLDARVRERSRSVWDYFLARRDMWKNPLYDPSADGREREREIDGGRVIFPRPKAAEGGVVWWEEVWGRTSGEMNGNALNLPAMLQEREVELESPGGLRRSGSAGGVRSGSAGGVRTGSAGGVRTGSSGGGGVGSLPGDLGASAASATLKGVVDSVKDLGLRTSTTSKMETVEVELL
ncbi:phosphatidylinositol-3-phosphatase ymr1 [Rhizina undulata]